MMRELNSVPLKGAVIVLLAIISKAIDVAGRIDVLKSVLQVAFRFFYDR